MNQNADIIDPKGQGMPPPYTDQPPPPVTVITHSTHTQHTYPEQPSQPPPPPIQAATYQGNMGPTYQGNMGPTYQGNMGPTVIPVMVSQPMGPKPSVLTCRSCNEQIVTRVELKSSSKTHLFALLLCIVFWPCVCLPYCIDSCQNADHYCPNCNAYIGSYTN